MNTSENTKVELTPAEIQMIEAMRIENAAKAAKFAAEQALKHEKEIARKIKVMAEDKKTFEDTLAATKQLFDQMNKLAPGQYILVKETKSSIYELKDWHYEAGERVEDFVWSDSFNYEYAEIAAIGYKARVAGFAYRSSNYSPLTIAFNIRNFGYDLENKKMTVAKTIHTNIQNVIDAANRKITKEQTIVNGKAWLLQHCTELHPTAVKIEAGTDWVRQGMHSGYESHYVMVTFENKFKMKYFFDFMDGKFRASFSAITAAMDAKTLVEMFAK